MIRKPNKSSQPSVFEAAWAAIHQASCGEDIDALRKEGWKTSSEIAKEWGVQGHVARFRLHRRTDVDRRKVRLMSDTGMRTVNIFRPKMKG